MFDRKEVCSGVVTSEEGKHDDGACCEKETTHKKHQKQAEGKLAKPWEGRR